MQKLKELEQRIKRLEKFISRGDDVWDSTEYMLEEGSLRESIRDVIEDDVSIARDSVVIRVRGR